MKASELRIGNLVKDQSDKERIWEVINVSEKVIDVRGTDTIAEHPQLIEYILPIPLTEEWLFKFGFEHENTIGGWSKWSNKKLKLLDMKFYFDSSEYFVRIEYVHQLQNLYFVLTGEELELRQ